MTREIMSRPAAPSLAPPSLTPVQQDALERVIELRHVAPVIGLVYHPGTGGSTVARTLVAHTGGCVLRAADYVRIVSGHPPEQFDDLILTRAEAMLRANPALVLDDLGPLRACSAMSGARSGWMHLVIKHLSMLAAQLGHTLVMTDTVLESWEDWRDRFGQGSVAVFMTAYGPQDYAAIARNVAGAERVSGIDFAQLHAGASQLNGWQVRQGFERLAALPSIGTAEAVAALQEHGASNTRADEVEDLQFDRLAGHEEIVDALQTHVLLPFEHPELARRLGLRPKRGVLLFGPPGTGKTSVGRVLARRMKGRFFLIDGSFVTEPEHIFYAKIEAVIAEAKKHAPSVLFIDDADALFGIQHISGFARYLLTLLDGLQGETSNQVCVMLTAMDVRPIPPALLRSGRVELWLETRYPDAETRARMLRLWLDDRLPGSADADLAALAQATEGFTPADLRRVAGDAKILYAADIASGRSAGSADGYVRRAVAAVTQGRLGPRGPAHAANIAEAAL